MNLYEPYTVLEKNEALLSLSLSKKYKIVSVLASRVLPLLILILVFLSSFLTEVSALTWSISGILFVGVSMIIIFNTSLGSEVFFKEASIELYTLKLLTKRGKIIPSQNMDYIEIEIFSEPRLSGAFYRLVLKNGRRVLLLKFPVPTELEKDRFIELDTQLEQITGLKIRGNLNALE